MNQKFVRFYSPGTLCSEETIRPINSWNVNEAIKMSKEITERHNAKPYGFMFFTKTREDHELDSKETDHSCMYYLGGEVQTLEEIESRNDPKDRILISNMKGNGYLKVIVNTNSYHITLPLKEEDIILKVEV
jgi:hypothetical protein